MAIGFCVCHRTTDRPELLPAPGAAWHYLCDKPVLPPAEPCTEPCGREHPHFRSALCDPPEYDPEWAATLASGQLDDDGEAQRIAEVYADARAELDRGL